MEKSEKITLVSTIVLVGFFIAVIFHYSLGFYLNGSYPFNTFLGNPTEKFTDFTGGVLLIKDLAPFAQINPWANYFPLAYILYFPFAFINNVFVSYGIFLSTFLSFLIYSNIKFLKSDNISFLENFSNIFIMTFLCYPVLFLLDKGNLDAILLIFFTVFVFLFKNEKYLSSSILLSVINAIKPFPILFLFLFLFKKRYKEFFFSIIITMFLVIGGFMVLKGNFFNQVVVFIQNLAFFKRDYIYANNNNFGMIQNSSLFMAMKLLFCRLSTPSLISTVLLDKIYSTISILGNIIILFFVAKEQIFWRKIALLTFSMLLFSYVVLDYKLVFLLVPMWLFLNAKETSRFDVIYSALFGLLFIPKNIIITNYPTSLSIFSISIILNSLLLISFIVLIIIDHINNSKKEVNNAEV